MSVCMYVCMPVSMYVCMYVCTLARQLSNRKVNHIVRQLSNRKISHIHTAKEFFLTADLARPKLTPPPPDRIGQDTCSFAENFAIIKVMHPLAKSEGHTCIFEGVMAILKIFF